MTATTAMDWNTWKGLSALEKEKQMDRSALDARFAGPYSTGERIEVVYQWGTEREVKRGYVGRTTGWKPVYILMHNSRSMGSSNILDHNVVEIRRGVSNRKRR